MGTNFVKKIYKGEILKYNMAPIDRHILLTRGLHIPLIKISPKDNSTTSVDHLIKKQDQDSFSKVYEYLARDNYFDVFLMGDAISSFVFTGKQDYKTIDLIATAWLPPRELEVQRVISALSTAGGFNSMTIKNRGFKISSEEKTSLGEYMNIQAPALTEKFILQPGPTVTELEHNINPQLSPISLMIYDAKVFN